MRMVQKVRSSLRTILTNGNEVHVERRRRVILETSLFSLKILTPYCFPKRRSPGHTKHFCDFPNVRSLSYFEGRTHTASPWKQYIKIFGSRLMRDEITVQYGILNNYELCNFDSLTSIFVNRFVKRVEKRGYREDERV
jgi:hypothetical protein